MGDGYGPMVVTREPMNVEDLRGRRIAIPGEMTTAFLALNLLLGKDSFRHDAVMFDRILEHVASGQADAGLIIHEGQLTYQNHDLYKVVDLGEWWKKETDLPLPLGGNCIRRDHGAAVMAEVAGILKIDLSLLFGAPDPGAPGAEKAFEVAANERDEQLLLAGRETVGMEVGMPKRHPAADSQDRPKDDLDRLIDSLDELDL